jgi:hypothetical protein
MSKEKTQATLDVKHLEDIEKRLKEGIDAVITNVEEVMSQDYYNTKEYDNRKGWKVTVKTADGLEIHEFFGIPEDRGLYKSNIFAFKRRYGSYPQKNITVLLILGQDGFWHIDY